MAHRCVCLLVSAFNALVGTTGGVTFSTVASILPPTAVDPVHGLVEGAASAFRWGMSRSIIDYRYFAAFVLGGLFGFALGWPLIGHFSPDTLRVVLGVFILLVAWVPIGLLRLPASWTGGTISCMTLLVGATGPLVAAVLARRFTDHRFLIGTQAACTAFQHGAKAFF